MSLGQFADFWSIKLTGTDSDILTYHCIFRGGVVNLTVAGRGTVGSARRLGR